MASKKITFDFVVTKWGVEFNGTCTGTYSPGREAKTYGPPENCYPADPSEFDCEDITLTAVGIAQLNPPAGADPAAFYRDFEDELSEQADEAYTNAEEAAAEDEADYKREQRREREQEDV